MKKLQLVALLMIAALFAAIGVNAQTTAPVTLNLSINESLSLACTPSTVTFSSAASATGEVLGNVPVSCTTTYNLGPTRTHLALFVFASGANALTSGGGNISASNVAASINAGTYNPCSSTDNVSSFGCDSGGYILANNGGTGTWPAGTATDSVGFEINLTGTEAPGAYTGTVTIQAMAL